MTIKKLDDIKPLYSSLRLDSLNFPPAVILGIQNMKCPTKLQGADFGLIMNEDSKYEHLLHRSGYELC